jgi:hypothetical protein
LIQTAKKTRECCGSGILVDFHGHVHPEARIELGYKLSASKLSKTDEELDIYASQSSIRNLVTSGTASLSETVRGARSMGDLFELSTTSNSTGYESVPSPTVPHPLSGEKYFQGGYNIERHGSKTSVFIDAIQIDFPRYLRDD